MCGYAKWYDLVRIMHKISPGLLCAFCATSDTTCGGVLGQGWSHPITRSNSGSTVATGYVQ